MSGAVGKALTAVLQAGRGDFNQRFKLAQQQYRTLTADAWHAFIRDTLNPVAEIVAAHDETAVPGVINVLYDQALPLVAKQWLGATPREPVLAASYKQLLAALAPALAREPERVSSALLNALHHLGFVNAQRASEWTKRLAAIAGRSADVDKVLALGRVLAWRVGLASCREAALRAAPSLPVEWTQQALDLAKPPDAALWQRLTAAPAIRADESAAPVKPEWLAWCGGFRGLGGVFAQLPAIGIAGGRLAASDGEQTWWLAADGYGQQLVRMGQAGDWPLAPGVPVKFTEQGALTVGGKVHSFPELETARAAVWHGGILAVVLRTSYQVALLRFGQP